MTVTKHRRLVNPGRRKARRRRNLSPLQKLFFGTKRQRASVKANRGKRKRNASRRHVSVRRKRYAKRKRNVSSILSVLPNPGRRRRRKRHANRRKVNKGKKIVVINRGVKMARTRKRRRNRARRYSRRRNPVYRGRIKRGMYKYSSNPGRRRRRRHNSVRRRHYRRNPGMLSGTAGKVVGVLGGIAVTRVLVGFVPAAFSTGILGYFATGAVAMLQGKLVGKLTHNPSLGNDFMIGGLAYLAVKLLNDFLPSVGSYVGLNGMGQIGGSSFFVPQVPVGGNMGRFVTPAAISAAMPVNVPSANGAALRGLRRTGRLM